MSARDEDQPLCNPDLPGIRGCLGSLAAAQTPQTAIRKLQHYEVWRWNLEGKETMSYSLVP
jgi:hypothetical protein